MFKFVIPGGKKGIAHKNFWGEREQSALRDKNGMKQTSNQYAFLKFKRSAGKLKRRGDWQNIGGQGLISGRHRGAAGLSFFGAGRKEEI